MNLVLVQQRCLREWSGVLVPSQEDDCSKMGFTGVLSEKLENIYPNSSKYLPATLRDKVHNLTLAYWCKAVTDLCGTSRSPLERL